MPIMKIQSRDLAVDRNVSELYCESFIEFNIICLCNFIVQWPKGIIFDKDVRCCCAACWYYLVIDGAFSKSRPDADNIIRSKLQKNGCFVNKKPNKQSSAENIFSF